MSGIEPQFLGYPAYSLVTVGCLNATKPLWKSDIDQEPYSSRAPAALRGSDMELKPRDLEYQTLAKIHTKQLRNYNRGTEFELR